MVHEEVLRMYVDCVFSREEILEPAIRWHSDETEEPARPFIENDILDQYGCPTQEFSSPIVAIDENEMLRFVVFVWDYSEDPEIARHYWEDVYNGEKVAIKKWAYL